MAIAGVSVASPAEAKRETAARRFIVVLADGADPGSVAREHARRYQARTDFVYRRSLRGYAAAIPPRHLDDVRGDPRVLYAAEDRAMLSPTAPQPPRPVSARPGQFLPDAVDRVDGDLSSAISGDGSGSVEVNVAVLDTGVDLDHPDLHVVGGKNCLSGGGDFDDRHGHGTASAGLIAASDNSIGVVGVAPGARIWSVRVLDAENVGTDSSVICGIEFVTASRLDADPSNDIVAANLSLGRLGADEGNCGPSARADPLHQAICASVAAGVTYVASAGNDASDLRTFVPAAYDEVLTVTAVRDLDGKPGSRGRPSTRCQRRPNGRVLNDDVRSEFSNFATLAEDRAHTVAAPGFCVESTARGGGYQAVSGTSFSGPLVTGVVALCIHSGPCAGMTPAEIAQKIAADAAGYNLANPEYGYSGDPILPVPGRYYGFLVRAALY